MAYLDLWFPRRRGYPIQTGAVQKVAKSVDWTTPMYVTMRAVLRA